MLKDQLRSVFPNGLVSLVVATVNRVKELGRLFGSLEKQSNSSFEVVLVDQNHDDRLASLIANYASSFPIHHLRSAPGLSKSRNVGLLQCRVAAFAQINNPAHDIVGGSFRQDHFPHVLGNG